MQRNVIETLVGALVLAIAGAFAWFTVSVSSVGSTSGYRLIAQFQSLDGINTGTDVKLSGIKVGTVVSVVLDPKTYFAVMEVEIEPSVLLPNDTVALVATEGLLGGRYLKLLPGASDDMLKPGQRIAYTQGPVDIAELLGKVFFSAAQNAGKSAPTAPSAGEQPSGPPR